VINYGKGEKIGMKKVTLSIFLFPVIFAGLITGCSKASVPSSSVKKFKIGLAAYAMNDEAATYVVNGAMRFASEHQDEIDLQIGDSKADSSTQLSLVENWCAQSYDAIIVTVIDSTMGLTYIDLCKKAGIPLIAVNRALDGMEGGAAAYIGSDELQAGKLQAQFIADQLGGKGNVAVLMGIVGLDNTTKRTQGYYDIFQNYPNIKIVQENTAKWERAEAMKVTENWLQMNLDLNAIVSNNDEMAIGAANALRAEGIKDRILVLGIDAIPAALEGLKAGLLDATVFQPLMDQGYSAAERAYKVCKGEVSKSFEAVWIDFELVTPDKADEYLTRLKN
jgi:inositol transport system substrate-binding protein